MTDAVIDAPADGAARRTLAPAGGGRVRKPDATLLADKGEEVVIDGYWNRRLAHGDVVDRTPKPKPAQLGGDA